MAIRAWRPVNEIKKNQDQDQYLYHYTTMEKYIVFFVQIKYGSLILFSKQVLINDVFEHKKTQ